MHRHRRVNVQMIKNQTEQEADPSSTDLRLGTATPYLHSRKAGITILLEGKKKSEANSMDEESSRKSHGRTVWGWGEFLQNKGLFYFARRPGKSHHCITESHILWESLSSHWKGEILGDINWSFTNAWRQREQERITKQATECHPTTSLPPPPPSGNSYRAPAKSHSAAKGQWLCCSPNYF